MKTEYGTSKNQRSYSFLFLIKNTLQATLIFGLGVAFAPPRSALFSLERSRRRRSERAHKSRGEKNYKAKRRKMPFMKVLSKLEAVETSQGPVMIGTWPTPERLVMGLLVLMFALILAVDALLVTFGQAGIPLSDNDVKGITGVTFVIIAIFILINARKSK
jgi:hypothetical protein